MQKTALAFGVVLIVIGAAFFAATGYHFTALIPSFIGFALVLCGIIGAQELRRKTAMHAAAGIAFLGLLGCFDGVLKSIRHLLGEAIQRPAAQYEKALTAFLCVVFLALCIQSFRNARRLAR